MKAQPSYIRTIKPNQNRSSSEYDDKAILHQIKYLGLQENIRVRRAGFAYRNTFEKMIERCFCIQLLLSKVDILKGFTYYRLQLRTLENTHGRAIQDRDVREF